MTTNMVNLTAHPLTIIQEDGVAVIVPPSGRVARINMMRRKVDYLMGVPVYEVDQVGSEGIPDPEPGTVFVVSQLIQSAFPGRTDLLVPDQTLKRKDRTVIGARAFTRNKPG